MIPKIHKRGQRTLGLLHYLYGPGTSEEHTDPHLVASWDHNAPDPGRDRSATLKQLQRLLDQPVLNTDPRPKRHVWHLSVRNSTHDRTLTDQEWGDIARRMVAAAGIDDPARQPGCRWAAVRHADDHIHIVATLVREDGYTPKLNHDATRVQAQARLLETELGLRRLHKGDGTAAKRPTSAEHHKARRHGRTRTAREELRETVRRAAAGTHNESEFFERLAAAGLITRTRTAPSGDLLGYKVALPGDRNKDGNPVFYAGARLAPDLSLPRVRERWSKTPSPPGPASPNKPPSAASARRTATTAAWRALLVIQDAPDTIAAAHIAATGEVLDALAATSAAHTRHELRAAATDFERASRSHIHAERGHEHALRQAARELTHAGPALGRGEDGATTAMVIDMLAFLATAIMHWHAIRDHAQQAASAAHAAEHLRAAYQTAAAQPLNTLRRRGHDLSPHQLQQLAHLLQQATPELADHILQEPSWPALAALLAETAAAGHSPAPLLADAAQGRELRSARSVSEVLIWRLLRTTARTDTTPAPQLPATQQQAARHHTHDDTQPTPDAAGKFCPRHTPTRT
ncbi:mobilization protein [Streptomyces tardus]|uniref:mobilization protein n=1 Tax=Streptomyces tardus TaxID=2780544 RepID=UPI001F239861|nr:mobilization protein [Streptomyces tardus]